MFLHTAAVLEEERVQAERRNRQTGAEAQFHRQAAEREEAQAKAEEELRLERDRLERERKRLESERIELERERKDERFQSASDESSYETEAESDMQGARLRGEETDADTEEGERVVRPKRHTHTSPRLVNRGRGLSGRVRGRDGRLRSTRGKAESPLMNAPKIMVGSTPICKPWTPYELMDMTSKAPNPISRPDDFGCWFRQVCSTYNCLMPDVQQLLVYTYKDEWPLCKDEFVFPAAREDGQWPTIKPLSDWLDNEGRQGIKKCSRRRNDFSHVVHCVQGTTETVPEFIQRFMREWDANAGLKREENQLLAVNTLVNNLRNQVGTVYKMSSPGWHAQDWKTTIDKLMGLHRSDVFVTDNPVSGSKQMAQQVNGQSDSRQGGDRQNNRSNKRRGNCRKCGKYGHWARECRSGRQSNKNNNQQQQQPQQQAALPPAPSYPALTAPPVMGGQPAGAVQQMYYNQA